MQHLIERVKISGYGVTDADVTAVLDAVREGKLKDAALTEKQQTLVTEVVAMQMEETFGSEDAINRLVGEKPSLAKRILERIKAFLQTFGKKSEKDPEAVKQLRRTEELFRKALEKAGVGYAHDELTRMNEKNVQVSEENGGEGVDESGEVRYNGGEVKFSLKRQRYISYDKLGKDTVNAIRNQLYKLYRGVGDSIANDVAVEIGDTVYIVDSGKDKGKISFGVKEILVIDDANVRQQVRGDINDRAVSKGIVSDAISERIGRASDQYRAGGHERELQEKLSADQGKSQHQQGGVLDGDGDRGVGGEQGYFSDAVDRNAGAFDSWAQIVPDDPEGERNYLSDVKNRGRKVGADDLYEGEQERNRTGNQESGGYDHQIDWEEADRLIKRLRELYAQLDAESNNKVQKSRKQTGEVRYNGGKVKKSAKIVKYIPYSTVGQNHIDAVRRQLIRLYEGIESGAADGVAIENGDAILVVDSGKENGSVRFGVRKKITIKNNERRNRYVQRINQESADNGFGDRTVFKRLGADLGDNSRSDVGRELRGNKANSPAQSSNHQGGVLSGSGNRGVSVSKPQVKKSRKIVPVESHEYRNLVNTFGVTKNYEVAGYLLGNGLMLDFSGKHWGDDFSTSRQVDHRDVLEGLGYDSPHAEGDGVGAMIDMIGSGNIRLMPETGGINLAVMPNETQMRVLRGYINHFNGEIVVDVDEVGGDTIHSFEYNRGTASARILSDIEEYFKSGTLPQKQSDLGRFRYSRKQTGETVTISKGQILRRASRKNLKVDISSFFGVVLREICPLKLFIGDLYYPCAPVRPCTLQHFVIS